MPDDRSEPAGRQLALLVNEDALAVGRRSLLPAPDSRLGSACRTLHGAAAGRAKIALLNLGGMVGAIRHRVGKKPAFRCRYNLFSPVEDDLAEARMERNIILGVSGFDIPDSPARETPLYEQLAPLKIEVVPLKRRDLAHAKTAALGYLDHRAIRLAQCRNDVFELFHSEKKQSRLTRQETINHRLLICLLWIKKRRLLNAELLSASFY
jgi:hypothetical protein